MTRVKERAKTLHCWKDKLEHTIERYGWGSDEYCTVLDSDDGTCMLADGHDGPHIFTPDDQIIIEFTDQGVNMKPPMIEEVQARIEEMNYNVDAYEFWSFYAQKGWKIGKSPMVDWHIALGRCNGRGWAKTAKSNRGYAKRNARPGDVQRAREQYQDYLEDLTSAALEDKIKDPGALKHVMWLMKEVLKAKTRQS